MSRWRLPLRIARRESVRRPWRSLLVVLLVAVPVAGTMIATVVARTDARTDSQRWDAQWGVADVVTYGGVGLTEVLAGARLDPDRVVRTATYSETYAPMRTDAATARATAMSLDPTDPIWGGRFTLLAGRTPSGPREVALSPRLADRFDVGAGGELRLARPAVTLHVSGVVEDRDALGATSVFVEPGVAPPVGEAGLSWNERLLVDLGSPTDADLQPLLFDSMEVRPLPSLQRFAPDDQLDTVTWSVVVGALVLAVLGIVIAAAFAAGGRSQLVSLGQLSATGAPPAVLRRLLVLQGTVTGVVGTVVGLAAGAAALLLGHGLAERALDRRIERYDVGFGELVAIAAIGVAGATAAALVPSRALTSVPTLTALAGRRPVAAVRPRFTAGGLASMGGGFLLLVVSAAGARGGVSGSLFAAVAIAGGLALLFGAAALTPAMVERLDGIARRADGPVRLALRGLARNRVRSGAIVAAVGAAGALAVAAAAVAPATGEDRSHVRLGPAVVELVPIEEPEQAAAPSVPREIVAEVEGALSDPVVHRTRLHTTAIDIRGIAYALRAPEALVIDLQAAADLGLSDGAMDSLREHGAVLLAFNPRPSQRVSLQAAGGTAEADLVFSHQGVVRASGLLVTDAVADQLGGRSAPGPVYVVDADGIDDLEQFDLVDVVERRSAHVAAAAGADEPRAAISWHVASDRFVPGRLVPLLTAVAVTFALLVVAVGLALAAADDRADRRLLTVVGAGPRTLAGVSGIQAGVLALLGLLLSVPLGYLPVMALQTSVVGEDVARFPLPTVVLLLAGVPAVAYAGARTTAAVAQRLRPLRVSTLGFD